MVKEIESEFAAYDPFENVDERILFLQQIDKNNTRKNKLFNKNLKNK